MDSNLRNLKDFLTLYNKVTELCFSRCVETLYERDLSNNESACVDKCVTKFARFNQKMMSVYVEVQTEINQKRMQELEETQRRLQEVQGEAQSGNTTSVSGQAAALTTTLPAAQQTGAAANWAS